MEGIEPEYLRLQDEYLERLRLGEGGMKQYGKDQEQPVIRTYVTYGMHEDPILCEPIDQTPQFGSPTHQLEGQTPQ